MINFGHWIRSLRKERQLDIRAMAELTGVEVSTISRVENAKTQVTLITAIRLCEGLGKDVSDVLAIMREKPTLIETEELTNRADAVPTLSDVEQFLSYFQGNKEEGKIWLSNLLDRVILISRSAGGNLSRFFVPEDIQKLLFDSPVYRFEIQYPLAITAQDILVLYKNGAMLALADISEYCKKIRREKQLTQARLEQTVKLTPSILSRLESETIEQIKLADVLMLDEQLEQEGNLLSMYWSVYSFYERLVHRYADAAEQNMKLASIFILTCRWLQFMNPQDITWISNIRSYEKLA